jgi:hypothetical protein
LWRLERHGARLKNRCSLTTSSCNLS